MRCWSTGGDRLHHWWCIRRWMWLIGGLSRCVCHFRWRHRLGVPTPSASKVCMPSPQSTVDATAAEAGSEPTRGCRGLLLQNVILCGIKPAGGFWNSATWVQMAVPSTQTDALELLFLRCRKGCPHPEGTRRNSNSKCMHSIEDKDVSWQIPHCLLKFWKRYKPWNEVVN